MASTTVAHDLTEKKEGDHTNMPPSPETEKGSVRLDGPVHPGQDQDTTLAILELVKQQDIHHPMHWPAWKRWSICAFYCSLQLFVTITSTSYVSAEYDINLQFGGNYSTQVRLKTLKA